MEDDFTPSPAKTRSRSTHSRALEDQFQDSTETPNKNQNEDVDTARRSQLRDLQEWLEEFTVHFVDEEASTSSDAPASSSREPPHQEPPRKVVSGKHSSFTHFPRDRKSRSQQEDQNDKGPLQKTLW